MRLMRSVGHNGSIVSRGFGTNIAVGQVLDFDERDEAGVTVGEHLAGLEHLYEPVGIEVPAPVFPVPDEPWHAPGLTVDEEASDASVSTEPTKES